MAQSLQLALTTLRPHPTAGCWCPGPHYSQGCPGIPGGDPNTGDVKLLGGKSDGKVVAPILTHPSKCMDTHVSVLNFNLQTLVDTRATYDCIRLNTFLQHCKALGPLNWG